MFQQKFIILNWYEFEATATRILQEPVEGLELVEVQELEAEEVRAQEPLRLVFEASRGSNNRAKLTRQGWLSSEVVAAAIAIGKLDSSSTTNPTPRCCRVRELQKQKMLRKEKIQ